MPYYKLLCNAIENKIKGGDSASYKDIIYICLWLLFYLSSNTTINFIHKISKKEPQVLKELNIHFVFGVLIVFGGDEAIGLINK